MITRRKAEAALAASLLTIALAGCTGGQEGSAAEEQLPKKNPIAATESTGSPAAAAAVDAGKQLKELSKAIPLYAGAAYREDLTRRDA
ncbi:MAG TPA: hypothetical protein VN605_08010, partial [Thermoanaerobaculia bacterium]|nr:hypothetical protein [Thermoanaerobaculia bacterium]